MVEKGGPQKAAPLKMVSAVIGWSLTAALLWSLHDASALAEGVGVTYGEAWKASVATGSLVALALAPGGLFVGWLWHHKSIGVRLRRLAIDRAAHVAAFGTAAVGATIALSALTFGSLSVFRRLFGSELVHQLALSLVVPTGALLLAMLATAAISPLRTLFDKLETPSHSLALAAAANALAIIGWGFALTRLGFEIWQNLALSAMVALVFIGAAAILGGLFAHALRPRRIAMVGALFALTWSAVYLAGDTTQSLRLALVYGDSGTGHIQGWLNAGSDHSFATAERNRGQSAVCFPHLEPSRPGTLGRVGDDGPDIIWLTIDALRWDRTTMGGYERDTTPNLAAYAKRAALFEWAYTPATSTRQTMRALFTGTHPSMIDPPRGPMWALTLPDEQHTVAEYLGSAGYHTAAFSSEENIFSTDHGGMRGFDFVDETPVDDKLAKDHSAPRSIDLIIEQLDTYEGPQFLWSHLIEPHQPYRPGPDPIDFGPDDEDRYDAALHFTDREVARLLEFVEQRQHERPTYLIITSDHGHAFGEHGTYHHGRTVFDVESRVPLIIWGPDIEPARYTSPVAVLDIFATTFELAGLDIPVGTCSHSLAAAIRSGAHPPPRPVYLEQVPDYSRTHFSLGFIDGRHKLLIEPRAEAVALYDLVEDPTETRDLSSDRPELLEDMMSRLHRYWTERGMDPADYGF